MGLVNVIPKTSYIKFQGKLIPHPNIHFFFHNTICRLLMNYKKIPYREFTRAMMMSEPPKNDF